MRVPIIAANWKMHKTIREAENFAAEFPVEGGSNAVEVVICPPFTALQAVREGLRGTPFNLGAQNMYPEEKASSYSTPGADNKCKYLDIFLISIPR